MNIAAVGEILYTAGAFVAVLLLLVLAHEIGHFATARAFGVGVDEFGVGFPPRLFSFKRGETRYSINALPLGGFVKLAGEEDPKVPRSLASKSPGVRVLVLSAGALMNALLPLILFTVAFMVPHDVIFSRVEVREVKPGSPAAMAGIQPGDFVLQVGGREVNSLGDLQRLIQLQLGLDTTMLIQRPDSSLVTVRVRPRWQPPTGEGATGIVIRSATPTIVRESLPIWRAVPEGFVKCIDTFILFKNGIIMMFIGTAPVTLAGPVGIAQITGEAARAGLGTLLEFAAFLSINLAIINIFPLPALDGGRIAFVVLEWLRRGKRVSPKVESLVHMVGFALLMAAILLITYQDLIRIISGESLIK